MRFVVLGGLAVFDALGNPFPVQGRRRRLLLGLLLVEHDTVVPVDRLLESVWPGTANPATVHVMVSRLRALFAGQGADPVIESASGGYLIRSDGHSIDVARFTEALSRRPDEALDLWTGRPLAGLEPGGVATIDRLAETYLSTLESWATAAVRSGDHGDSVVRRLRAALSEAPLREQLWALLISAYLAEDSLADAAAAYRQCREVLSAELAVAPGPEIERAYEGVRRRSGEQRLVITPGETEVALRDALLSAADFAASVGGWPRAVESYRAVLRYGNLGNDRPRVLLKLGESLYHVHEDARPVLETAAQHLLGAGDVTGASRAKLLAGWSAWLRGDGAASRPLVDTAADLAGRSVPGSQRDRVLASLAGMLAVQGQLDRAVKLASTAISSAGRLAGTSVEAAQTTEKALINRGIARRLGGLPGAEDDFRTAIASHRRRLGWAGPEKLVDLAELLVHEGRTDEADRVLREAGTAARSHGTTADLRWVRVDQAQLTVLRGPARSAAGMIRGLLTEVRQQPHYLDAVVHGLDATLLLRVGETQTAVAAAARALELARRAQDPQLVVQVLPVAGHVLALAGDRSTARVLLDEYLDLIGSQPVTASAAEHLTPLFAALDRSILELAEAAGSDSYWLRAVMTTATRPVRVRPTA